MAGVREMGGKLGRSPFLLVGVEGIPMRREKSLSMYHRLSVCPFFANEISGIRLALLWISDIFKCLNPNSILRRNRDEEKEVDQVSPFQKLLVSNHIT